VQLPPYFLLGGTLINDELGIIEATKEIFQKCLWGFKFMVKGGP
jgi:hypothetical protein